MVDLNDDAAVLLGAPRLALLGRALPALVLRMTSLPDLVTTDPRDTGSRSGLLWFRHADRPGEAVTYHLSTNVRPGRHLILLTASNETARPEP